MDQNLNSSQTLITPKLEPKLEPVDEPPTPVNTPAAFPSDQDVYSEFYRIQQLFRSTMPENDENCAENTNSDSRAIVPFSNSNPQTQFSNEAVTPRVIPAKQQPRSSELVRIATLRAEEHHHFGGMVRKTRMLYDSLRIFGTYEDEKKKDEMLLAHKRKRADLKAAALIRNAGMWLFRDKRIVGRLPGVSIGDVFFYRMEMCVLGLHGQPQAGIDYLTAGLSSTGEPIATSVIVSGGYEDDEDVGDVIIYSGHGGQDRNKQVMHQVLESGNLAMERSMNYGVEVRVIRGFKCDGSVSGKVYVYDGLYKVIETWFDYGKSGFGVYKFKLVRIENQGEMGTSIFKFAASLKSQPIDPRRKGYVGHDLSRKKEKIPVLFYNEVDGNYEPLYYDYLTTAIFPQYIYNGGANSGCQCVGNCMDNCFCAMRNGGEFPYDHNGVLVRGKPLIYECGPDCSCPPTCRNRITQNGVRNHFEVFRSRQTGWGVRSLDLIQAGSFICEYTGVVLTREQAHIFTMNGDRLIHPSRFTPKWKEWGDLSAIFKDYVCPKYPSIPPLDFAIDVSKMRNVACYISHSSSPNVFVQPVLYDHNNVSFPHLMLFAIENIPPMRDLSFDYGVATADESESKGKLAICN